MKKIIEIYDKCIEFLTKILSVCVMIIMVAICVQVFSRFFGHPILWTTDVSNCLLVALGFLGAGWLLKHNAHVSIDLVYGLLNDKQKRWNNIINCFLGIITSLILVVAGAMVTYDNFIRGTEIVTGSGNIPKFPLLAMIPIGMFFMLVEYCRKMNRNIKGDIDKEIPIEEKTSA